MAEAKLWIIAGRYDGKNEPLLLNTPLRMPIFTTPAKAREFRKAVIQGMEKPAPLKLTELTVLRRKRILGAPAAAVKGFIDPKPALFDPPISEASRAILMIRGVGIIPLVDA